MLEAPDYTRSALLILGMTVFTVAILGLAVRELTWRVGGLSGRAVRGLAIFCVILFLTLTLAFWLGFDQRSLVEAASMALWIAVFSVGVGIALWLRHKEMNRG